MRLESAIKHFSPKSLLISDSSRATASDALTGTDVMAALGMCQAKAEFGLRAYLGKVDVSIVDKDMAIEFLTQFGINECLKVEALRKVTPIARVKVVQVLAKFAYKDYCRSAASTERCECCKGKGLIAVNGSVIKSHQSSRREVKEVNHVLCTKCAGKGTLSVACNDCRGRGITLDKESTEEQGVPVHKSCKRCSGRGYERLPASNAYRAVKCFIPDLSQSSWSRHIKPLYDDMIIKCHKEESFADNMLNKVTR